MRKMFLLAAIVISNYTCEAQSVSVTDVINFFQMKDSVRSATDHATKIEMIHRLYLDKASEGLTAFMRNKTDLDEKWLNLLQSTPAFWDSLALRSTVILDAAAGLEKQVGKFSELYPEIKPAKTFFLVGIRQQGGTIRGNLSLIGTEVVLSNPAFSANEMIRMALHEYVHTQQVRPDFQKIDVLSSSIREGACDFIASVVSGIPTNEVYMQYGSEHEAQVWKKFQEEMNTTQNDNWVSTGNNPALMARDLGYFVGYRVCQSYYDKATDKKSAIKQIIELNYLDKEAIASFLQSSGYNGKSADRH